jgi:Ca2+-binding EF-hand superfamily protein
MWIDDDDVSLQSLIEEMSAAGDVRGGGGDSMASAARSLAGSRLALKTRGLDEWSALYPYDASLSETSVSPAAMHMLDPMAMLDASMQPDDPLARPGARTAYETMRGGGRGAEEAFSLGQEGRAAPPLLLRPPGLPGVDEHVGDENLHVDAVRRQLRQSKGLWDNPNRDRARRGGGDTDSQAASTAKSAADAGGHAGGFSGREIKMVVKFIDNLGDGANAGDGTVDVGELEHAFRQGRRTRASAQMEAVGAALCRKFERMLKTARDKDTGLVGVSVERWFRSCDKSGAGKGDGQISTKELRQGIKYLDDIAPGDDTFSEEDIINFVRYLDPEADGDMGLGEFQEGLKRSKQAPAALKFAQKAGRIMGRLEGFMNENSMRIKDLFKFIDKDRSGHITLQELREGLLAMNTDVAAEFAKRKEGLVAARKNKEAEKVRGRGGGGAGGAGERAKGAASSVEKRARRAERGA